MTTTKHLNGIFKIEKVPAGIRKELTHRVVGNYPEQLEQEEINYINDLLYLAWFYAHDYLRYSEYALSGTQVYKGLDGTLYSESLDGKVLLETNNYLEHFHFYFNESSTVYTDGVGSDFSDVRNKYGLEDFSDALRKIEPEKIQLKDILTTIHKNDLKYIADILFTMDNVRTLDDKKSSVIGLSWLFHHNIFSKNDGPYAQLGPDLVENALNAFCSEIMDTNSFKMSDLWQLLKEGYQADKIIELAGWNKPENEYYLKRHFVNS